MLTHQKKIELLSWTCKPVDWFCSEDSDDEFELRDDDPSLATLRKDCPSVKLCNHYFHPRESPQTLLSLVHRFVGFSHSRCNLMYEFLASGENEVIMYHSLVCEKNWHAFQWKDSVWVWNDLTLEWFYVDKPTRGWQRYYFYKNFPLSLDALQVWWFNIFELRWFLEPSSVEDLIQQRTSSRG